jgi:hypothetical protein
MFCLTNILAKKGYFGNNTVSSQQHITWHYDSSYIYYDCDRNLNTNCPRVKNNLSCGDCKGTTNIKYALIKSNT